MLWEYRLFVIVLTRSYPCLKYLIETKKNDTFCVLLRVFPPLAGKWTMIITFPNNGC